MWSRLLDLYLRSLIRNGSLSLQFPDGSQRHYGEEGQSPSASLHILDEQVIRRLAVNPDLALGEAYMDGKVTIGDDDIHGLLTLAALNTVSVRGPWMRRLYQATRSTLRFLQQYNPVGRARDNVAHHYDLSGELYELFLDEDRQYSCAYFRSPEVSLEQAQADKKAHIAQKLLLEPGARVLDIGCGWGGMGLTLARDYGARVTGVTLSQEQQGVAARRAKDEGLSQEVEFRLQDYREVEGRFDRIVSVGMFEHVGAPHYREYFEQVRDKLNAGGIALIHTIGRCTPPGFTNPWIARYIFPGGYIPAMSEVVATIEKTGLVITDVEVLRYHYADTLQHWYRRFMGNIDRVREIYDERFCRMWRFYLAGSEVAFRMGDQVVFQFQLARRGSAVPMTREYMYRGTGDEAVSLRSTQSAAG